MLTDLINTSSIAVNLNAIMNWPHKKQAISIYEMTKNRRKN